MKTSAILTYHSLDDSGSVISTPPAMFRGQMEYLKQAAVPVVPLEELPSRPGSVAITFDDGFQNFYTQALPVLQDLHLPATVFVVSGYCGRTNLWPSQPAGIPELPLMSWREVCDTAFHGIAVGAHTVTHPYLTSLTAAEVKRELEQCRAEIQDRTGLPVSTLAYPYGDWDPAVRDLAAQQFGVACTTELGMVEAPFDALGLPRVDMYYMRAGMWFRNLTAPAGRGYVRVRRCIRDLRKTFVH